MTGRGEPPAWLRGAPFSFVVALVVAVFVATDQGGERRVDVPAYVFAAGFGALLLARQRFPRVVLAASMLAVFADYALRYSPAGAIAAAVAVLFVTAAAGLLRWAVGAAVVGLGASTGLWLHDGQPPVGYQGVATVAVIVAAIALGYGTHSRRLRVEQEAEIARLTAERADLHDAVGQAMSAISLQAGVAAEKVGEDDFAALEAMRFVRATSGDSLRDVQSVAHQLREDEEGVEVPYLSGISSLVESARGTGLDVSSDIDAGADDLPPQIETAAFRVVQESLTSVVRHSGATHVLVRARVEGAVLRLTISDDGHDTRSDGDERGHGLAGMRERLRILGGSLEAGPSDRGFTVEARLPVRMEA